MLMYTVQVAGFFSESRAGFNSNFVINKNYKWLAKDHMKPLLFLPITQFNLQVGTLTFFFILFFT